MGMRITVLYLALLLGVAVACSSSDEKEEGSAEQMVASTGEPARPTRFAERGVSLEIPSGWSVSGFSETVFPRRLVAASYPVARADVEGDCGGLAAVERLPSAGAYIVLIDYGGNFDPDLTNRGEFKQRLPLTLADGQLAEFECFGRSYAFHFISGGRGLQAHIGLGADSGAESRADAVAALNSIRVERSSSG